MSAGFLGTLYLSSLAYEPYRNSSLGVSVNDGCITLTPPAEPYQMAMVLPVQGFGSVYVYADGGGQGFTAAETELEFTLEAAKTRAAKVRRWLGEQATVGFSVSGAVEERLANAVQLLERAQRAETGSEERSCLAYGSLRDSLWAGEMAVLEKARSDIARRGPREGFLFGGANLISRPVSQRKRDLFLGVFNYATVVLHWRAFEPRRGEKAWERVDELAAWLGENHITMKAHPLLWMSRSASPDWVLKEECRDFGVYKQLVLDRAYQIVERYRGTVDIFDVAIEAHDWGNAFDYSQKQLLELTGLACDAARDANPEAIRVIDTLWEWGQYVATDSYNSFAGVRKSDGPLMSPAKYLGMCLEAHIGFEVIGLPIHNPVHDILEISLMLDRYAGFGKPIHITEVGVPSAPIWTPALERGTAVPDSATVASTGVSPWGHPCYWHQPPNEDVQADWYEQFYTLCYSKPFVSAVTNWLWEDAGTAMGLTNLVARARGERPKGWPPYTGFVKSDLTPKQSYYRLKRLIDSWRAADKGIAHAEQPVACKPILDLVD